MLMWVPGAIHDGARAGMVVAQSGRSMTSATTSIAPGGRSVTTDIPFRLDRLPWSSFHWLLVAALR